MLRKCERHATAFEPRLAPLLDGERVELAEVGRPLDRRTGQAELGGGLVVVDARVAGVLLFGQHLRRHPQRPDQSFAVRSCGRVIDVSKLIAPSCQTLDPRPASMCDVVSVVDVSARRLRVPAPSMSDTTSITVEREIPPPTNALFDILSNPHRHTELDGSGFVTGLHHGDRLAKVGQKFTMNMTGDHMGGDYQTDNIVSAYDENKMIGWKTAPAGNEPPGGNGCGSCSPKAPIRRWSGSPTTGARSPTRTC